MPKNLGLYNDDLSTPRKKDVDACDCPNNAPPYLVTSVNGQTGDVTVSAEVPENLVQYDVMGEVEATQTINADTLQDHAADYFATATQVGELSTQIGSNTQSISDLNISLSNKVSKTGDTMTGALIAQNNTNYSVAQVRNIIISTSDPSGGSNGDIWIKYVE